MNKFNFAKIFLLRLYPHFMVLKHNCRHNKSRSNARVIVDYVLWSFNGNIGSWLVSYVTSWENCYMFNSFSFTKTLYLSFIYIFSSECIFLFIYISIDYNFDIFLINTSFYLVISLLNIFLDGNLRTFLMWWIDRNINKGKIISY